MAVQTWPLITAITLNDLEDKYVRVSWFHEIAAGTSGAITIPPGGTVVLDAFAGGVDALSSTMENGYPTWDSPLTASGSVVAATLDSVGNYTLSATPSAYPVALIYQYRVSLANVDETKMLGSSQADTYQGLSPDDAPKFAGLTLSGPEVLKTQATPSNPAAGFVAFYVKNDGILYALTSGGTELPVGGAAAGSDKQIQYNDAGAVAGDTHFTFDKNNDTVLIGVGASVLPNNPLSMSSTVDSYAQVSFQNKSEGASASTDFVATADNGDDSNFFCDFGINSSIFADPLYSFTGPNDSYFYAKGGHLAIGTATSGKNLKVFLGGTTSSALAAEFSSTGLNLATGMTFKINGTAINKFTSLTDCPASLSGQGGKAVYVNSGGTALEFGTPSAATTFLGLSDTPSSYSGQGLKAVRVNTGATALEFFTLTGGGDMLASTYDPGAVAANVYNADNHIDGTTNKVYSATEKTKLSGIAAGAEVNVQADWNSGSGDSQILNKPSTFAPTSHANAAHSEPFAIQYNGTGAPPTAVGKADGTLYFKYV
jgi:hypothetical protein